MPYFLFFEPHSSPEVVMGPISQMRKPRPGDVSSHAQGSPGATWPVKFLPRPPILLLPVPCWFCLRTSYIQCLDSGITVFFLGWNVSLKHALPKGAPAAVRAAELLRELGWRRHHTSGSGFIYSAELVKQTTLFLSSFNKDIIWAPLICQTKNIYLVYVSLQGGAWPLIFLL